MRIKKNGEIKKKKRERMRQVNREGERGRGGERYSFKKRERKSEFHFIGTMD